MDPLKRKEFLNWPNYISMGRIAVVPLVVIFMMLLNDNTVHQSWNRLCSFIAALIYGVASASDMLDGWLARHYKMESAFGKFFDPLADKLLNMAAMIMLIPLGRIWAWLVILLLVREVVITMLRGVAANEQIVIQASKWGKYKNAFGSFGIAFLILHYPAIGVNWILVGWVLLLVSAGFSIGSGISYVYNFVKAISKKQAVPAA